MGLDQVTVCWSRLCWGLWISCALLHTICSQQAGSCQARLSHGSEGLLREALGSKG